MTKTFYAVSVQTDMSQALLCRECQGKFGPGALCPVCIHLQRFRDYLLSSRCPGLIAPQVVHRLGELHRSVLEDAEAYWSSLPPAVPAPLEEHPTTAPKRLASPKASGGVKSKGVKEEESPSTVAGSPPASGGQASGSGLVRSGIRVKAEKSESPTESAAEERAPTPEEREKRRHRRHRHRETSTSPRREEKKEKRKRSRSRSPVPRDRSGGKERKSREASDTNRPVRRPQPPAGPPPGFEKGKRSPTPPQGGASQSRWRGIIPAGNRRGGQPDPRGEIERKKKKKANKGLKKREQQAAYKRQFQSSLWRRR